MDKVISGNKLSAQEKALLEYTPWALLGRLLAVTRGKSTNLVGFTIEMR